MIFNMSFHKRVWSQTFGQTPYFFQGPHLRCTWQIYVLIPTMLVLLYTYNGLSHMSMTACMTMRNLSRFPLVMIMSTRFYCT